MDHFLYRNGILHAEDVAIPDIAATVGTPFYVYSTATLTRHYHLFTEALSPLPHMVCFAIKSLSNIAVLKTLGDLGAGMDVVSGGEYRRAKAAGVPGDRIVFLENNRDLGVKNGMLGTVEHVEPGRIIATLERAGITLPDLPLGKILCVVNLVDCCRITSASEEDPANAWELRNRWGSKTPPEPERSFGNYEPGRWAWVLEDLRPLKEPIPARGYQGLWTPTPELVEMIQAQVLVGR